MYSLALEYRKLGHSEQAVTAFEALVAAHPRSGAGWLQFGGVYEDQDDFEAAVAVYQRGLTALGRATDADERRSVAELQAALDTAEAEID